MKKNLLIVLFLFISVYIGAQDLLYEYQNGKQYCTIEIDTLNNAGFEGSLKALDCYRIPYYEMVFQPTISYDGNGDLLLTIIPRWHYYSFLEKVYGENEKAQEDLNFKLTFKINNENNTLEYVSTQQEKDYVTNKSSYSNHATMNFTKLPKTFTRMSSSNIDYKKYPKELQRKIQERNEKMKDRLGQKSDNGDSSLFVPVQPYVSVKKAEEVSIENNEFE